LSTSIYVIYVKDAIFTVIMTPQGEPMALGGGMSTTDEAGMCVMEAAQYKGSFYSAKMALRKEINDCDQENQPFSR